MPGHALRHDGLYSLVFPLGGLGADQYSRIADLWVCQGHATWYAPVPACQRLTFVV